MTVPDQYKADVEAILAKRHDNGGDYWASSDERVGVGSPFSTIQCTLMLSDLGMEDDDLTIVKASELILDHWRDDGRFQLAPHGSIYPCHTAWAAKTLCRVGYASDKRLECTFKHLLDTRHEDGGWRCNKYIFGKGPETRSSNPGPTLDILDAFRFTTKRKDKLDSAVEFLLDHWVTRKPLGPCHFGMGTLFMKVEYPLFRYNLLNYVYVLSFYPYARRDPRFREALAVLQSRLVNDKIVVENSNRELSGLSFCRKGSSCEAATCEYRKILRNMDHAS